MLYHMQKEVGGIPLSMGGRGMGILKQFGTDSNQRPNKNEKIPECVEDISIVVSRIK